MNFQINRTPDGLKKYPLHKHKQYEIMHYLEGNGYLCTTRKNIPFQPGTILVVPPGMEHGSVSEQGFQNISIGGEFSHLFYFQEPVTFYDNPTEEGATLARMIYENRYGDQNYLSSLCTAYIHFLLQKLQNQDHLHHCIQDIVLKISQHAFDPDIALTDLLHQSGYAEDYIRSCFKRITGKTPTAFLTEIRIRHACFLIDIYKDSLPMSEIAEQCGYLDYVYFSKKFKSVMGMSPRTYQNQ